MNRIAKKILTVILIVTMLIIASSCGSNGNDPANNTNDETPVAQELIDSSLPRVVDRANMFTDEEINSLETHIAYIYEQYKTDVLIMTSPDHGSADSDEKFMNAVWEKNHYGAGSHASGWALFVCLKCKTYSNVTFGDLQPYATCWSTISGCMDSGMKTGAYYNAMSLVLSEFENALKLGPEDYINSIGKPSDDEVLIK